MWSKQSAILCKHIFKNNFIKVAHDMLCASQNTANVAKYYV